VLVVVPYFAPAWGFGGPPRVMSEEAHELVRRGHEVQVFTTDAFEASARMPSPQPEDEGLTVRRFRNLSNRLAHDQYRFSPVGLRTALRHVNCDVIHISEIRHELAIVTGYAARRRGLPLVVSAHGTLPTGDGPKGALKGLYDKLWADPMLRGAAAVLAQTRHEQAGYAEHDVPAERTHLLPLGASPAPDGQPGDLGVPDDARVMLFLGRIHPLKGVDRLVRGFAGVAGEHPDAVLVVAGRDDGAEADLRRLAHDLGLGDRVRFAGPIYGDARYAAYRRADLFAITPRHFEESSLASLEAASVGTPLLLGDEAEVPFLDEYRAGWRVPAGRDVAPVLAAALSGDLRAAGKGAQRMVEERHLWPRVTDRLEEILWSVVR